MSVGTYEEKKQLYKDSHLWNKPKRILFNPFLCGWMYLDAGYETNAASRNYDQGLDALEKICQKYNVDMVNQSGNPFRFYFRHADALGGSSNGYGVNDATGSNTNVAYEDVLTVEDYPALMEDETKAVWERVVFSMYPQTKTWTPEQWAEAIKEEVLYREAVQKANAISDKYQVLYSKGGPLFYCDCYVGMLFNQYRGMKGTAMDLRRHKDKVFELCEYMDNMGYEQKKAKMANIEAGPGVGTENWYDVFISSLAHTMLNNKQIERLIIAPWKKQLDLAAEKQKMVFGIVEGEWAFRGGIGEFLNEYPKGTLMVEVESDDPFEVRKQFPNIGIFGGISTDIMGQGTPEQAVAAAKKAIDELGRDGGLLLAPNKMTSYAYDMTPENLKAVADFVTSYEIN